MAEEDIFIECAKEASKSIAKDAYQDTGKPVLKPTGELLGLIPRTIKAVLLPLEKWVVGREYNLAETQKLLQQKLENIPPEQIVSPEAHIAVPAIRYISYCMDNDELRNMYANLVSFHSKCKVLGQRSDTVQQFREPGQRSVPRFF